MINHKHGYKIKRKLYHSNRYRMLALVLIVLFIFQPLYALAVSLPAETGAFPVVMESSSETETVVSTDTVVQSEQIPPSEPVIVETTQGQSTETMPETSTETMPLPQSEVYTAPSDGSLAGEMIKLVNLYWETDDLGTLEVVFDGGSGTPQVQIMRKMERGIYETQIPNGDFSRISFRKNGTKILLGNVSYNLYGVSETTENTEGVSFVPVDCNTFYYDMGENPSYWGEDPQIEATPVAMMALSTNRIAQQYQVSAMPGDMVYFIDIAKVEYPQDKSKHAADRIHIAFLKKDHKEPPNFDPAAGPIGGETFTMYERRNGIYAAPFPPSVNNYSEIAFQLVKETPTGEIIDKTGRHFNFRGEYDPTGHMKYGYFKYNPNYIDAFFYNTEANGSYDYDSFWDLHPSRADASIDTEVIYIDAAEKNNNGIVANVDDMWISWEGMKPGIIKAPYDPVKGYKVVDVLPYQNVRYFQFPYNCGATENTMITLTYTVRKTDGSLTSQGNRDFVFKFPIVKRSKTNCLNIDYAWDFNGQTWSAYNTGGVDKETVFYRNKKTKYDSVYMRVSESATGNYATTTQLKAALKEVYPNWTQSQIDAHVVTWNRRAWLKLDRLPEPNEYEKENIYSIDIPTRFTHVQFRGVKNNQSYYSNREEISTAVSYPCYYSSQIGNPSDRVPNQDVDIPGITGFWNSIYSADTEGDQSIDIPESAFMREADAYYANATFYDYYSDWEMTGRRIADVPDLTASAYHNQACFFNDATQAYYKKLIIEQQKRPLSEQQKFRAMYAAAGNSGDYALNLWQGRAGGNIWTGGGNGPVYGLADAKLTSDGRVTTGASGGYAGVEMPFFNEDFLRGNNSLNTAIAQVYKNVLFPFKKDTDAQSRNYGYWVFNSADRNDAMRLSYDVNNGYFLERTKDPVKQRSMNQFFPFSDAYLTYNNPGADRNPRLNCLFGTRFNIDFTLTDDLSVYNEYTNKDEAIRFEFQGDDDAWVYVDGILALDMGGVHDAVRGEINFKEGTYTIWKRLKLNNTYEGSGMVERTQPLPQELVELFKQKNKTHTLTMFYMERGLYESNLKLSFNFPHESKFSVEKDVDFESGLTDRTKPNIFANLLRNLGGFQFDIRNLVTSGQALPVEQSAGYISAGAYKVVYGEKSQSTCQVNHPLNQLTNQNGLLTVEQGAEVKGAIPSADTLLKIKPLQSIDASKMSYVRLAMRNLGVTDSSAQNLYLSFVDTTGHRVGGYVNTLGYEGEINMFNQNEDSTIRVDFRHMTGDTHFDWSRVDHLLIGVRRRHPLDRAAYTVTSVAFFEALNKVHKGGFSVNDDRISDYGSYASGTLTPVHGAWYTRKNKQADGTYDAGVTRQTDRGAFALGDNQKVVFTDKFRTGSYIALMEKNVREEVFQTNWTIMEDGKDVNGKYLLSTRDDSKTVINPYNMIMSQTPLKDIQGKVAYDQRKEVIEADWPKANTITVPNPKEALVYRSYISPDASSNIPVDISVAVKNTLKYGELTITKKLSASMQRPDGTYPSGDYVFDIYYTDIVGMGLEGQLTPVQGNLHYVLQTVTVHVDETGVGQVTVPNIPAGTTYNIKERPSNGTKLVDVQIGNCEALKNNVPFESHRNVQVLGVTGTLTEKDYSKAFVEGVAYASNQHIIFTNERKPFYMDIAKVWNDGMTDADRPVKEVHIRLQRRQYVAGQAENAGWITVTKDFFDQAIGEVGKEYVVLTAPAWKTSSMIPLPSDDPVTGISYEYRIQEIDEKGILTNYAVSYDEVRNPDIDVNGKKYLYVTYRATNTPAGLVLIKQWDDQTDLSGVRPKKIRVQLLGSSDYDPVHPEMPATWQCYQKLLNPYHVCSPTNRDCYVELEKGSGWKKTANNLLLRDEKGKPYYYKMAVEQIEYAGQWVNVEDHINGYAVTYGEPVLPQGDNSLTISVKNTLSMGNIRLVKRDAATKQYLENARFKIERLIPQAGVPDEKLEVDLTFAARTGVSSALGVVDFAGLAYGKYRITEIEAPSGYLLLKKPIYITIDDEAFKQQALQHLGDATYDAANKTINVTVTNEKLLVVPETGGYGTIMFTIVGTALCVAAALLYIYRLQSLRRTHYRRKK